MDRLSTINILAIFVPKSVCTDGWDSHVNLYFWVSIMYISDWKLYKIPIGLAIPESKSSDNCTAGALEVAAHVGVTQTDIISTVNDTTSSAIKTGCQLAGDGASVDCKMHVSGLLVDHAIGKRTQPKNRQIVDDLPICEALRVKHRSLVSHITSSKAKGCFELYKTQAAKEGKECIKFSPDNDTRIAGTHRMFRDQLCSRWCM
jgi:hypothetical protein